MAERKRGGVIGEKFNMKKD
jgi:hypothetical protein